MLINYIRWGWVILCFGVAAGCLNPINKPEKHLLAAAMGLTVIADFFILITPYETIGVAVFIIAQMFHVSRNLRLYSAKNGAALLFILPMVIVVSLAISNPGKTGVLVYVLYAVYAFYLITAFIAAILRRRRERNVNSLLLMAGFALFVCCDICVALYNTSALYGFVPHIIWVFYGPSQLLIALSIYNFYKIKTPETVIDFSDSKV